MLPFHKCEVQSYIGLNNRMDKQQAKARKILQKEEGKPNPGYVKDSDYYFDGYSHFNIHEEMLKDKVRTNAYMKAILDNRDLFKGKIVLDVGSGTGILSIFAAKAGAKHVYAIEKAGIFHHSIKIIEENGLSDKITVINGKVEEIELPVDKVDIIISEWMGYFLIYESMLDSVLYARNKWLREGGILLPNRAKMYVAALDDTEYYSEKLGFWDNVYGVNMTCMKKWVLSEPMVDIIDPQNILSNSVEFFNIDLSKVQVPQLDFHSKFELVINFDSTIHCLVCWFDCDFSCGSKKLVLSTSPYDESTHWKQTIFYLSEPIVAKAGDIIKGKITASKAASNPREIDVKLNYSFNKIEKKTENYRIS